MEQAKKISYRSLTEKMSDETLKHIIAGSGGNYSCNTPLNCEEDRLWCCKCVGRPGMEFETARCAPYQSDAEAAQDRLCVPVRLVSECEII